MSHHAEYGMLLQIPVTLTIGKDVHVKLDAKIALADSYNNLLAILRVEEIYDWGDSWIAALGNGTRTRAQVLREISESTEVYNRYFNQAFVVMQYFGYLLNQMPFISTGLLTWMRPATIAA